MGAQDGLEIALQLEGSGWSDVRVWSLGGCGPQLLRSDVRVWSLGGCGPQLLRSDVRVWSLGGCGPQLLRSDEMGWSRSGYVSPRCSGVGRGEKSGWVETVGQSYTQDDW